MAHYFITSEEDPNASAIEIAQAQRIKLFNNFGQEAQIIEVRYNFWHSYAQKILGTEGKVINLYQYYQNLKFKEDPAIDRVLINQIMQNSGYEVKNSVAYRNGKVRIKIAMRTNRLYTASYYDQYGFLDRKDYYDDGCLSYTEFFEDRERLVLREYYNNEGRPVIRFHFRGGQGNRPILSLIQLYYRDVWRDFDNLHEFRAYFFDEICRNDLHSVLYADRSNYTLDSFKIMEESVPRYMIFHSAITIDGQKNGQVFPMYQGIKQMLRDGSLTGLISSTNAEADDAANIFDTDHSYAIPVTYTKPNIKQVSFAVRTPYNLIAVARLDEVKRLDHIIRAVTTLHRKFPQLKLTFYGLLRSSADEKTEPKLRQMVTDLNADQYIFFGGFVHDLTEVYDHAWIEILTSKYEGFAMALLEAQEHGCPAIAYNINYGPNEIISDNYSGKLVPAGNENELVKTLDSLLSNPNILEQYSYNAYRTAQRYSFKNVSIAWQGFQQREGLLV